MKLSAYTFRRVPFFLFARSLWLCRRGHVRLGYFERKLGADWPVGWLCPRCSQLTDLDGRFLKWTL